MLPAEAFQKFLLLLPFAGQNQPNFDDPDPYGVSNRHWSYREADAWSEHSPQCVGFWQSPIHLRTDVSIYVYMPPIRFGNYDTPLNGRLTLINNGHSVAMRVPLTVNGHKPYISGGILRNIYEAESFHFHWGARGTKGSEHMIDGRRFDVELHIVHRNTRYPTIEAALEHSDGLAVLGIMLKIVFEPDRIYPGLHKIYNALPLVTNFHDEAQINGTLSLGQILGDVDTREFFTYRGSITTPPCTEAVIWTLFPEPLQIPFYQMRKFWNIRDSQQGSMSENFRPVQPNVRRPVFYRVSQRNPLLMRDID